jgi:hypothetical protein
MINGNQINGVHPADNLEEIRNYISAAAPPVLFEVRTPSIKIINPSVSLPSQDDSQANRELAESRMKAYMQLVAKSGAQVTAGALRLAGIDGVTITDAVVKLGGSTVGIATTTILEYPYIGEVVWE